MSLTRFQGRVLEAIVTVALLFIPVILSVLPELARSEFPGPYTGTDAVLIFFITVPLLFIALAAYRVAQHHGLTGVEDDPL